MSAETTSLSRPAFSVRIVVCDHYSTKPIPGVDVIYSEFRGSDIKQVPVLRIFGSAPDGQKVCLHVHGVFPYFYVPCPVSNPEPQFLYQMAASLDKALNIAMKQAMSANQHVYKITLVKGLPFYGFHDKEHLYLKVFLYNPGLIKQAVDLCSNGAILGQTFQPHEAHLNFTLQFFIDFNLFGMSNMDLQSVIFRKKPGISQSSDDPLDDDNSCLKPESMCYYEVDCSASHIINRQRIGKGDGIENPGLEEVWKQEQRRRQELNMSMASKSLSQGRLKAEETESHYKFQQMCLIKMSNQIDKPVDVGNETSPVIDVSYPAESLEGSQLLKAVDVSVHLPDNSLGISLSETLRNNDTTVGDFDDTLVDESVALNSSLHYSQVLLDSEDLNLVNMLQDLDENRQAVEDDSVLSTRTQREDENDDHCEVEYSQIFNEETIIGDPYISKDDVSESSPSWNDSFWEDANIPQLDGTFDDDHVKKVRKRKMRPFKLGLSKPKSKKNFTSLIKEELTSNIEIIDSDEINASRQTIDSISSLHLKNAVKAEGKNILENVEDKVNGSELSNESITDLVNKAIAKYEVSETYDFQNKYKPVAGPSTCNRKKTESELNCDINESNNESFESSAESNDLGFISFYNASKLFDASLDGKNQIINKEVPENHEHNIDAKMEMQPDHSTNDEHCNKTLESSEEDMKLYYSETPLLTHSKRSPERLRSSIISSLVLTPKFRPPTKNYIASTLKEYNIPQIRHPQPFCSNHKDVGDKVEIGQVIIKLHSHLAQDQKPFGKVLETTSIEEWRQLMFLQNNDSDTTKPEHLKTLLASNRQCILEPVIKPPTTKEAIKWVESISEENAKIKEHKESNEVTNIIDDLDNSQAIGLNEINNSISLESIEKEQNNLNESLQVTMQPDGSFLCFGSAQKESGVSDTPVVEMNFLTVMVCEVYTDVRGDLNPDPLIDQIQAVFISVKNDCPPEHFLEKSITEIIVVDNMTAPKKFDRCFFKKITYVNNESEVIGKVIELIQKHDPDIMCGYEIEMNSWGYILERSQVLGLEMIMEISRITEKYRQKRSRSEEKTDFEGRIIGRVLFNVWRLFRHELALSSYSFENCMYEVLKERVPKYSFAQLSAWWNDESRILRWIPVEYYLTKLSGTVRMLEKLDIINRTAELARLFGIQWWEVLTRGSQFRVESLMLRAARAHNLLALSPSVQQRAAMPAPATLPLIYEPESRFYADPVIVLDFQSLYPSMMIAYNYCFSTCIGKLDNITGDAPYPFGAWKLRISKQKLSTLAHNELVHWSPTGAGFVRAGVRRGVLPALLRRILAARQAVKAGMKRQTDEEGRKAMHSRQLGLKLIANVTYGYTAANFSGRMPCVEVADSVVAKGRETLERAIKLVENGDWNVKVVYGDTDSMFVLAAGRSRADAFRIGQQIADAVTADNPSPVALKLEKVYQPCILQTKKRYVGFMYESETAAPIYEAKGIETVRRDSCPAAVKVLQRSLVELFTTGDMSAVKQLVTSQLARLASGAVPPQDLLFTREYHGAAGYRPGAAAPPHEIARRLVSVDRRGAPRVGWRVAWLVTAGAPGLPLVKLARTPLELRSEPGLRPHVAYYATRVLLPPLHRCLSLLGVNVYKWWNSLGWSREPQLHALAPGGIARYLWRERCALCGARAHRSLCDACAETPQRAVAALCTQLNVATSHVHACDKICGSCCGHEEHRVCENTECAMLWRRQTARHKLSQLQDVIRQVPPQIRCYESLDF